MSTTIYLRLPSEAEARAMFASMGQGTIPGPDGEPYWPSSGTYAGHRYDMVVIGGDGTIWRPTGEQIETDEGPMPQMEAIAGYHVNLLWHGPEALIPDFGAARLHPVTPECVFA